MKNRTPRTIGVASGLGAIAVLVFVSTYCFSLWSGAGMGTRVQAQQPPASEKAEGHRHTNALAGETSPYLLQHAHNPVDWHPWGEEALKLARQQNKPIFLSVGYSTCYWCHVMERESFENEEVARVLNENFIPIKVDREQRPDLDEQYMLATQLMTGRGGWPNSVWLTPDGRPWMAGTYFPRERFLAVLKQLAEVWKEQPQAVEQQADQLTAAIKNAVTGPLQPAAAGEQVASTKLVDRAFEQMQSSFDETHGGLGGAPKFPPHGKLQLLARAGAPQETEMLTRTLDAMWRGGIHDHVGGGFHRYSTDARWFLPHFEKMLYDNAQLIAAYAEGHRLTGHSRYARAVEDIFSWLSRDMTHPEGGFYSALDSESDGEEGKYYVWSMDQLEKVLGADDAERFARIYGFEPEGNYTEEATGQKTGHNIPYLERPLKEIARDEGVSVDSLESELSAMRNRLRQTRSQRPRPHLDDKILSGWNGLMISGLARAGRLLEEPRYTEAAASAAEFLLAKMTGDEGLLYRSLRGGEAELPGYLNDYAFLTRGLLELHQATGDSRWLSEARTLADAMRTRFEDTEQGGFFFTGPDHEALLSRSKNLRGSGNLPLGNGVAAEALLRLGKLTGHEPYTRSAKRTVEALSGFMAQAPGAAESLLEVQMMLAEEDASGEDELGADGPAGARDRQPPLTVRGSANPQEVRPGATFEVAMRVDIDAGWHLYGENPEADFLKPTRATVSAPQGFKVGETKMPEATVRQDPVFDKPLRLYEQTATFRIPVTVRSDAAIGRATLKIELQAQPCNDTRCLSPRTQTVEVPVTVADGGS